MLLIIIMDKYTLLKCISNHTLQVYTSAHNFLKSSKPNFPDMSY